MSINQLVLAGLNGYAVALDRDTGKIVWFIDDSKSAYVTLLEVFLTITSLTDGIARYVFMGDMR